MSAAMVMLQRATREGRNAALKLTSGGPPPPPPPPPPAPPPPPPCRAHSGPIAPPPRPGEFTLPTRLSLTAQRLKVSLVLNAD